jgi:flagellar assembly protein FliH
LSRARVIRGAVGVEAAALDLDLVDRVARLAAADPDLVENATEDGYRNGFASGQADGYAAGFAAGTAAAEEVTAAAERQREQRLASALLTLDRAASAFNDRQAVALHDVEDVVAAIAFELTRALVGRELAISTTPGRDAIARALKLAPERVALTVRVHPDELGTIDTAEVAPGRDVTLVGDPTIALGGCIVDAGPCRIDAELEPALQRVRDALGLEAGCVEAGGVEAEGQP